MSYTEYMRRKAAVAPVVINNQKLRTASELTQERRLLAASSFRVDGSGEGTMRGDLLLTETAVGQKAPVSFVKKTDRPASASDFTAYVGSRSLQPGNTFANGRTQNAGKLQTLPYNIGPYPILTPTTSITTNTGTAATFSSNTLTIPVGNTAIAITGTQAYDQSQFTFNVSGRIQQLGTGLSVIKIGVKDTSDNAYYFSIEATRVGLMATSTGKSVVTPNPLNYQIKATAPVVGDTFSLSFTSAIATFTYNGISKSYTNIGGFTGNIQLLISDTGTVATTAYIFNNFNYTVQQNALYAGVAEPVPYITGTTGAVKAQTVARSGSDFIRERLACQQAQGQPHIASEVSMEPVFKDDTIRYPYMNKQYLAAQSLPVANRTPCAPNASFPAVNNNIANHIAPRVAYQMRNAKAQIPVFNVPSKDYPVSQAPALPNCFTGKNTTGVYSRGGIRPQDATRYVERKHGNDLSTMVNGRKPVPKKFQIPAGTPAQLKINMPNGPLTPNM